MNSPSGTWTWINARLVTPEGILTGDDLVIAEDRIVAVGPGRRRGRVRDLQGALVLPGFIDLHVHGGGGSSFNTADPSEVDAVVRFHRAHGTARLLGSLVSDTVDGTLTALSALANSSSRQDGMLLGAHLEGPFLSHEKSGCHDVAHLLDPDLQTLHRLLGHVPDLVAVMTVAPELRGSEAVIAYAQSRGVQVAIGHSAADYSTAVAVFGHGIHLVTHAYQAMHDIAHRAPGIVGAATQTPGVRLELIVDGVHNHDAVVAMTFASAPRRIVLITDAAPAVGRPPGTLSKIGAVDIVVRDDGRITRRDDDTLAGSALTMDAAVRNAVAAGIALVDVVHAAATAPAEALGLEAEYGSIRVGRRADFVVVDDALTVMEVVVDGLKSHVDVGDALVPAGTS